ncbi:MAG: hypothetical protein AAF153_01130 [Pseudomonadota bacterium]
MSAFNRDNPNNANEVLQLMADAMLKPQSSDLMKAVDANNMGAVEELLDKGANPEVDLLPKMQHDDVKTAIEQIEIAHVIEQAKQVDSLFANKPIASGQEHITFNAYKCRIQYHLLNILDNHLKTSLTEATPANYRKVILENLPQAVKDNQALYVQVELKMAEVINNKLSCANITNVSGGVSSNQRSRA